ncbi:hypothetical protein HanPSC8_Chr08g0307871 [Helianthus annuus]|nr:hypothetical protein HanPSC8_Chr08g0307871 [Helianthus annuus]
MLEALVLGNLVIPSSQTAHSHLWNLSSQAVSIHDPFYALNSIWVATCILLNYTITHIQSILCKHSIFKHATCFIYTRKLLCMLSIINLKK